MEETSREIIAELSSIHKAYQLGETKVHALRGLSLSLARGEFTAVVGASGSGKSTLLNILGCIDSADSGQVIFAGQNLAHMNENNRSALRNEKIGFIFQSFNLVPVLNVAENVELPLMLQSNLGSCEKKDRVAQVLADVGLSDFRHQKPDKLSGGQRQRVAIARALVTQPLLVLADEPTANLDSDTTHRIIDLMLELNEKRACTFLFSTHDEKLMGRAKRILRICDGQIIQNQQS